MKHVFETLYEMVVAISMFCLAAYLTWPSMFLYEMIFIGFFFYLIVKFLYFIAGLMTNMVRSKKDE